MLCSMQGARDVVFCSLVTGEKRLALLYGGTCLTILSAEAAASCWGTLGCQDRWAISLLRSLRVALGSSGGTSPVGLTCHSLISPLESPKAQGMEDQGTAACWA